MKCDREGLGQGPRLYRDLADWYPLLTPVGDYAEEAAFYRRLFEEHCRRQLSLASAPSETDPDALARLPGRCRDRRGADRAATSSDKTA